MPTSFQDLTVPAFIEQHQPCDDAADWLTANEFTHISQAWEACERGDWMMWTLRQLKYADKDTLVLLACDFAEHVLPQYEKVFANDLRPRKAIEAARAYVAKEIKRDELLEARNAAYTAAAVAAYTADAAYAAAYAAVAAYTADAAYAVAAYVSAIERKWQADRIRFFIPNPFKQAQVELQAA